MRLTTDQRVELAGLFVSTFRRRREAQARRNPTHVNYYRGFAQGMDRTLTLLGVSDYEIDALREGAMNTLYREE